MTTDDDPRSEADADPEVPRDRGEETPADTDEARPDPTDGDDDEPDDEPEPEDDEPEEPEPEDDEPEDDEPEDEPDDDEATEDRADQPAVVVVPRWAVGGGLVAAAVLLVLVIAVASLAITTPADSTTPPLPEGAVVIRDAFARGTEDVVGVAETGQDWDEVRGTWAIGFDGVRVVDPAGESSSVAVVDLGSTDGMARMQVGTPAAGMGVVVRYVDPENYLAVVMAPEFGTWTVERIADGEFSQLATGIGIVNTGAGATIEVRMRGDVIDLYVDNAYASTVRQEADDRATGVGLIGKEGSRRGRWARFDAQNDAALTSLEPSAGPLDLGQ